MKLKKRFLTLFNPSNLDEMHISQVGSFKVTQGFGAHQAEAIDSKIMANSIRISDQPTQESSFLISLN
mgnify:CR=1 FL=1